MSLFISGVELPINENENTAVTVALKRCGLPYYTKASIYKKSIDARHGSVKFVYTIIAETENEYKIAEQYSAQGVRARPYIEYKPVITGKKTGMRPLVVGFGPAGIFAGLLLAENGYNPIIIERGGSMEERGIGIKGFYSCGKLDENNNIQFGEGGAGTYSDGKLFTRIGDERCEYILERMVEMGAPEEIKTQAHPHVGTDKLSAMVVNIRKRIISLGGEIRFNTKLLTIRQNNGKVIAAVTDSGDIAASDIILACGHSARDTYINTAPILNPQKKAFAIGLRIEHLRNDIDKAIFGKNAGNPLLGAAEYRLVGDAYTFCMCPGGTVVAAASEEGGVVTNGMSYYSRNGVNSNSAIVVPVGADKFPSDDPLSGIEMQRIIERAAFKAGGSNYSAPVQTLGDYLDGRVSRSFGSVKPTYPLKTNFSDISSILPEFVNSSIKNTIKVFGKKINGFDKRDSLLTAPETRTSSPIRLPRGKDMNSESLRGLYPCGEGAGYAGGILSAAVDGLKAAEQIMKEINPED